MFRYVKRLVPKPVKRALRRPFDYLARGMQQRIQRLESQVKELQTLLFEMTPDLIQPSADITGEVEALLDKNGLAVGQVNLSISKHDPMYQVGFNPSAGKDLAYLNYLRGGLGMLQTLDGIVRDRVGSLDRVGSFLDFASGYGRVTRFLAAKLEPGRVWASDIKARAVDFQRRQFGVNGVVSTVEPEELDIDQRFDVIFVASLFSHLPESTFARWLLKLCELCRRDGLIIFSVHDISLLAPEQRRSNDFVQSAVNEEMPLHVSDRLLDPNQYGLTYVSENYVRTVIEKLPIRNKDYVRCERGLLGHQDIYILSGSGEGGV